MRKYFFKNLRFQIIFSMLILAFLMVITNIIGFAVFSKKRIQNMIFEKGMNQVIATADYANYILNNSKDYLKDL
ncbi:hypothetical protein [Treponema phagedenis]|uniref:Uncharacterized protein n=3 Tax=Treponema phagedenis TaxID=162 RepID=A0AAE6M8Z8_TREPH|nr:hypothetical protein [Treponema phagedenis]QEJ96008.1 hypothetical protein FUT79_12900 [Treponema phagedenis]QEJ98969.1 hypothetical protein FUT82_13870 [Treponema phagedenis]QEK01773.1 hypothetical protein FUT84_11825 [Treponema phagedenis]QEK04477.1 hypothetical protein FUT83_12170 [Treponema phagedenis]QEK06887.1 hypothetical protein FUT80_09315 [Treponema phagedenis]